MVENKLFIVLSKYLTCVYAVRGVAYFGICWKQKKNVSNTGKKRILYGPRQANLVLIAFASSEGSDEPAHPRSLARTFAARSYKQ